MMTSRRVLRAAARGVALATVTAFCMLVWRLGAGWASRRQDHSLERAWRWRCLWFGRWARAALRVLHVRLAVRGAAPTAPFLLVCNHLGYLDVAVLAAAVDAAFVAKSEVAAWPVLGRLCRWMGTLFVDRRRRRDLPAALATIEAELVRGRGVVLFPEGTSSGGERVLRFHPPLLAAAVRAGMPVAWAALRYATPAGEPAAAESVCWWGDMPFASHLLALLALPSIEARLTLGAATLAGADRKELAAELQNAITVGLETDPPVELPSSAAAPLAVAAFVP